MRKKTTAALLISTYNWPEALELALCSALNQSLLPDEIVVADDGSDAKTKAVIEKYMQLSKIPIHHVWHEDKGFRLAEIRNKAIAKASSDYIIQIDGDIIMHPHFIADHIKFAKTNSFVRASRIYINEEVSKQMLANKQYHITAFSKGITNIFSAVRIPFLWKHFETGYKMKGDELYEIHGCNMAFWRQDAINVNGYNESFNGWGPEDKEFITRLLNSGVQKRFIKLGAIAFHIYHKENARTYLDENTRKFKNAILNKTTFCEPGINQYL